jgi:antitoxin (DNA-binding transcriptional repressor) of toxin-antitoxin stability system
MNSSMGIRALRDNLTATIRRVRAGETIDITHHGQRVATLAPARPGRIERLLQDGDITPPTPLDRPLERRRPTGGTTASRALEEDRAER